MTEPKFYTHHHADQAIIDRMYDTYSPLFILSTGRSGSKFVAGLMDMAPGAASFHEPRPTLQYFSNYAFYNQDQGDTLSRIIESARMELLLETVIQDKVYIESNQCLTFFAPFLKTIFKGAKFVHIIRHPGTFTHSAARKGWHKNDSIWESGRVRHHDDGFWNSLDHIGKLSWVWDATNRYIEDFKKTLPPDDSLTCKIEDLTSDPRLAADLFTFAGLEPPQQGEIVTFQSQRINEFRIGPNEPPNMKKDKHFPPYEQWPAQDKKRLAVHAGQLAGIYDYTL